MENTVERSTEKPRIFISYARSDSAALAEELVAGLELAGFEPYLDRHDIAAAEDWQARLVVRRETYEDLAARDVV